MCINLWFSFGAEQSTMPHGFANTRTPAKKKKSIKTASQETSYLETKIVT